MAIALAAPTYENPWSAGILPAFDRQKPAKVFSRHKGGVCTFFMRLFFTLAHALADVTIFLRI
jgi:hypothetical protein